MVNIKKYFSVILLISFTLMLSSCWSKRELNELAIVAALGVDRVDNEFEVSVQIVNPGEVAVQGSPRAQLPIITYHAKGKSVFEAIRKLSKVTPRKAYFAHLQMLVIGEELASEGITQLIDLLARDPETRDDFDVIVSKNIPAKEILNILTPIEKIPSFKILNSLKVSEKAWGTTSMVNIDDIADAIRNERSFVLSTIEIQGDKELGMDKTNVERTNTPVLLKYVGLSLFKQDKLVGLLTEVESKGYNFLNNNIKSTIEVLSCPNNGVLATEITESKSEIKGKFKNGRPIINVKIHVDQNVGEVNCDINLTDNKSIDYINKETEKLIKEQMEKTLITVQKKYQLDILRFGEALHRADYKAWNNIKDDWSTIFSEMEVNFKVYVNTSGLGTVNNRNLK